MNPKSEITKRTTNYARAISKNRFNCEVCHIPFEDNSKLIRHYNTCRGHPNYHLVTYNCKCGLSRFFSRSDLIRHDKTHHKHQENPCSYCGINFLYRSACIINLDAHMLAMHSDEDLEAPPPSNNYSVSNVAKASVNIPPVSFVPYIEPMEPPLHNHAIL